MLRYGCANHTADRVAGTFFPTVLPHFTMSGQQQHSHILIAWATHESHRKSLDIRGICLSPRQRPERTTMLLTARTLTQIGNTRTRAALSLVKRSHCERRCQCFPMIRFDARAQSTPRHSSRACFPAYSAHKLCIGVSLFAKQCHRADGGLMSHGTCFVALMIIPTLDTSANRQLPLSTRSSYWLRSLGLDTFPRTILASETCHLHTLIYDDIIAEVGSNIVISFQTLMKISSFDIGPGKVRIVVR